MRHLDIYIGKYIDQIDTQLTAQHIVLDQSGDFERHAEPGEPNLPASTNWSFVLDNLDHNGDQRYPLTWWESQARTQAEGAIQPLQIYVEARTLGHLQFRGIVKGIRYTNFQARCHVSCSDILDFLRLSKKPMLKSFEFDTRLLSEQEPGEPGGVFGGNDLPIARDLEGQDVDHSSLVFLLSEGEALNVPNTSEISRHLGWDNLTTTSTVEITRSAWVQIEDITLLTRVRFIHHNPNPSGTNNIYLKVWHNADEPYTKGSGEETVIVRPRGQYVDREGNRLFRNPQDPIGTKEVTLTLHEPNAGNGTSAAVHIDDTQLKEDFIFGVPYEVSGGFTQITSATYSYFDVVQTMIDIVDRELSDVHAFSGIQNFFDTTYLLDQWRHAFWSDILMYGWADSTLAEAVVRMAQQVSAYLYTTREGNIAIHSRGMHQEIINNGGAGAITVTAKEDQPLDGDNSGGGWGTYETEITQDILEINNQESEARQTFYANEDGQVFGPSLRNRSVQVGNFRTHDLGVPASNDPVEQKILRWSPGNANWPNPQKLGDFLPTALMLLHEIAKSMAYPTTTSKKRFGVGFVNIPIDNGQYLIDSDFELWWMRRLTTNPKLLTAESEVQRIDVVTTPPGPPDEFLARYLAFEEYLHDDVQNATFEMGQAEEAQLVFEPTESWESDFLAGIPQVIVDHQNNLRVYYGLRNPSTGSRAIAVMRSTDNGQTWQKIRENKNPGIVNDPDSNLIFVEPPPGGNVDEITPFTVYHDPDAPQSERYKAVGKSIGLSETFAWSSSESSNGLEFINPIVVLPAITGDSSPNSLFFDENENDWVIFGRTRGTNAGPGSGPPKPFGGRRWPTMSTSNGWDDNPYSEVGTQIIEPADEWGYGDEADQTSFWNSFSDSCGNGWEPAVPANAKMRPDIYRGNINLYHGIYIGTFPVFFRDDNRVPRNRLGRITGPIYPVFGITRDRNDWTFPDNEHPAVDLSPYLRVDNDPCHTAPGISETGQLQSGYTFAELNGEIFISVMDRIRGHYEGVNTSLPNTIKIYVQKLTEDRFGFLSDSKSAQNEGTWRTTPIQIPPGTQGLYVNAKILYLRAEVLDINNNVIPGFSRAESILASDPDSLSIPMQWENANIQSIAGNTVKLKFYFSFGFIYSFKFG